MVTKSKIESKLEKVVKALLTERFPDASINQIVIASDVDSDGDKILRITVVLASDLERLNRDNLVGLVRHLRPKLAEASTNEFPLISFVSAREAGKLKLAAA